MECTSCHKAAGEGLVCEACGAILPPRAGVDKFAALRMPRRFAISADELDTRYRELTRLLHPDRFAKAPARERMLSLQAATTLNEAYRTLKVPVKRAEYLLEVLGEKVAENDPVDPAFLMEILELREALAEAKGEANGVRLDAMGAEMTARRDAAMKAVASGFGAWDETHDRARLAEIKKELVALRYFQRFLDEHEGTADE